MVAREIEPRISHSHDKIKNKIKRWTVRAGLASIAFFTFLNVDLGSENQEFGSNKCDSAKAYLPDLPPLGQDLDLELSYAKEFEPILIFDSEEPANSYEVGLIFQVTPHFNEPDMVIITYGVLYKDDYGTSSLSFYLSDWLSLSLSKISIELIGGALDPHKGDEEPIRIAIIRTGREGAVSEWKIKSVSVKQHELWKTKQAENVSCDNNQPVLLVAKGKHTTHFSQAECRISLPNGNDGKFPFSSERCKGKRMTVLDFNRNDNIGEEDDQYNPFELDLRLKELFPGNEKDHESPWSRHFCGGKGNGSELCRGKYSWYKKFK